MKKQNLARGNTAPINRLAFQTELPHHLLRITVPSRPGFGFLAQEVPGSDVDKVVVNRIRNPELVDKGVESGMEVVRINNIEVDGDVELLRTELAANPRNVIVLKGQDDHPGLLVDEKVNLIRKVICFASTSARLRCNILPQECQQMCEQGSPELFKLNMTESDCKFMNIANTVKEDTLITIEVDPALKVFDNTWIKKFRPICNKIQSIKIVPKTMPAHLNVNHKVFSTIISGCESLKNLHIERIDIRNGEVFQEAVSLQPISSLVTFTIYNCNVANITPVLNFLDVHRGLKQLSMTFTDQQLTLPQFVTLCEYCISGTATVVKVARASTALVDYEWSNCSRLASTFVQLAFSPTIESLNFRECIANQLPAGLTLGRNLRISHFRIVSSKTYVLISALGQ